MSRSDIRKSMVCAVVALICLVGAIVVAHSIYHDGGNYYVKLLVLKLNTLESLIFAIIAILPIFTDLWNSKHQKR